MTAPRPKRRSAPTTKDGLLEDQLVHFPIPSSSMSRAYQPAHRHLRFSPVAGVGDIANGFSFFCNPWYSFTDNIVYTLGTTLGLLDRTVGTALSSISTTGFLPTSGTALGQVWSPNYPTNAQNWYSGHVRVLGVEVDIEYTGTELNCGGTVTIFHGAGSARGLISTASTAGTAYTLSYPSLASLQQDRERTTQMRFGKRTRFVWRPHDLEFHTVRSYRQSLFTTVPAATLESGVYEVQDVIANDGSPFSPVDCPFGLGFVVNLATTYAPGAALPIIVNMRIITDESLSLEVAGGVDRGLNVTSDIVMPIRDTAKYDKLQTKLTATHMARRRLYAPNPEQPFSLKGAASDLGSAAIQAGADRVASAIASAF